MWIGTYSIVTYASYLNCVNTIETPFFGLTIPALTMLMNNCWILYSSNWISGSINIIGTVSVIIYYSILLPFPSYY